MTSIKLTETLPEATSRYLNPTIIFNLTFQYRKTREALLEIHGEVLCNNISIGDVSESLANGIAADFHQIRKMDKVNFSKNYLEKSFRKVKLNLSPSAIQWIEECREKHPEGAVVLTLRIGYTYAQTPNPNNIDGNDTIIDIGNDYTDSTISIDGGKWRNQYAPTLGIGNFLLVELNLSRIGGNKNAYEELFKKLATRCDDIEKGLKEGNWSLALQKGRMFCETIRKEKNSSMVDYKDQIKDIMLGENHPQSGFDEIYKITDSLFNFISKYQHIQTGGVSQPVPIAEKEDAYFVYATCVGLLNFVGRKINRIP